MNIQSFFSSWNICSLSARGITWHNFMAGLTIETYSGLSLKIWGSYVYVLEFGQLICASGAVFKNPQSQLGDCRSSCGTHSQTCGTPKCRKLLICPLVQQETCPSFCCSSFASVLRRPLYFLQSTMFATGFLNHAKFKNPQGWEETAGDTIYISLHQLMARQCSLSMQDETRQSSEVSQDGMILQSRTPQRATG